MDEKLEAWIAECIGKNTFASRADAIEFCVGATRAFCEASKITQASIKTNQQKDVEEGRIPKIICAFPLKWSEEMEKMLKQEHEGTEADLKKFSEWANPYLPERTTATRPALFPPPRPSSDSDRPEP